MTALAGFWSFGAEDASSSVQRMLASQAIYGPHGTGIWKGGEVAMGRALHRTLPEDSFDRGPQTGASGLSLVGDVRLDNRDELASALGIDPADARSLPDAAILLHAMERWGDDAVGRFLGEFAFALWNPAARRLTLARDFLGHRPLHYHRGRDFFAFASMAKGLHVLPDVPYAPDMKAMTDFLALLPEAGAGTFFRDISKVEPGHIVTVTPEGMTARRYWQPNLDPLILRSDGEYEEAMREQMDRAVRVRLRGAERAVASMLSGGLDSPTVTATAARLIPEGGRVFAFTSVPREGYDLPSIRGSFGDEGPLAAATAALYPNVEHILVRTAGRSPVERLDRNFFAYERPVLNLCNQLWFDAIMEGVKSRGCAVLLTGAKGNMSFSYQGMDLLPRLLSRGHFRRLLREAALLRRHGTRLGTIASQTLGPFLPAPLWKATFRLRGSSRELTDVTAIHPDQAARLAAERRGDDLSFRPPLDGIAARMRAISRVDLGNYTKGVLAAWGIDMRDPTSDRSLVEFCLRLPGDQYLKNGYTRSIARRAFVDRLPAEVVWEKRKGLQAVDWHEGVAAARDEIRGELERIAGTDDAATTLDTERMKRLVENWPEGDWHKPSVFQRHRIALLRGVSAGHFIRKASRSNQ